MATYTPISGITPQYSTTNNELASGYYLKFYKSGTTTPLSVATDSSGATTLAKVKLNPLGMPISNPLDDDTIFIPHVSENYRVVLYVNETDADNNDTASAVFNIDGLAPDIQQLADSADISLRENTLQIQDDYDRSPLLVDGSDFTAGAGPHTITVPSGWDPTGADFRLWRLDASTSVAEALTPTATTTSSFTVAETLLSTDVLFIGDDDFRNQADGDPIDIRTRLSVYSKSEGDSRYLGEADNLSDLDNVITARTNLGVYSKAEANSAFLEDSAGSVGAANLATTTAETDWILGRLSGDNLSAGSVICWRDDTTISTPDTATSYPTWDPTVNDDNQQRSVMILGRGTVRVTFTLKNETVSDDAEARILKNGTVVNTYTEPNESAGADETNVSEDISVEYGDIITIQQRFLVEGSNEGGTVETFDRRIQANERFPVIKLSF